MTQSGSARWLIGVVAAALVAVCVGIGIAVYEVWPGSKGASPKTTTWQWGDFEMQVPVGWTSQTYTPGGDFDRITFTNSAGDEYMEVDFNRCSACLANQVGSSGAYTGTAAIQNLVPSDAQDVKIITPTEITYTMTHAGIIGEGQQVVTEPGHVYKGLVILDRELSDRMGLDFSVRTADSGLVDQIIKSVHQSR